MTREDMFGGQDRPPRGHVPATGLLATNHLNLFYMLSAGLLLPPSGFDGKHYEDTLGSFPGWIPLFLGGAPLQAITQSTAEARHLKPVLIEVSLIGLSGRIFACRADGTAAIDFPRQLNGFEDSLLIPAPLPTSRITSIVYPSTDDKRSCEADARDYGNVPIKDFKGRSNKTMFTRGRRTRWPPPGGPVERVAVVQTPLAAGGAMAMMQHFGNLGDLAVECCRSAFDPEGPSKPLPDNVPDAIGLDAIRDWMTTGCLPSSRPDGGSAKYQDACAYVFWGAVEKLLEWRREGRLGDAEEVLLRWLAEARSNLDSRSQVGIGTLIASLSSLRGLASDTTSELFERHPTPTARAMTLFFLRGDCADLLDFEHDALREPDSLMAAVLFGARDGWLRLPLRLRAMPGLAEAVSYRMARMAHRMAGTELSLGESPPRVRTLRELLVLDQNSSVALDLARRQKWDCIHTRVSLGRGEYRLVVAGGAARVEMAGEPKVDSRVDLARLLRYLAESRLDPKAESKVRGSLRH
ncbi:MAG: hypothetical protein OXU77_22465 [Gammaproteobacteria bacterium]|nr:hypothetical protein [Gammaproteobacteria bacterium]MDE0435617.1 hypothetical protein [Bryobacterales bacterium]